MDNEKELMDCLKLLAKSSERDMDELEDLVDEIIEYKIQNENTISQLFDNILSVLLIEDDRKREVFHKLSNYTRKFNKELADDYDEILEEDLSDDEEY